MIKPENGGNNITKNSRTFFNALTPLYKINVSYNTEMSRACIEETGINNKDRNQKRPLGRPRLRWEDCVVKDVGGIVNRGWITMKGSSGE